MQLDSVDGAHFSSVAVSVSRMYARSLASWLFDRPAVERRAAKRTILVPAGAGNVQLALASPSGRGSPSTAVSAPPAAQPLLTCPVPDFVPTHPTASFTGPSGSRQENTE